MTDIKEDFECCEVKEVHKELIDKITMPPIDDVERLADLYKLFGDVTRLRILFVLSEAEVCVCDLAEKLDMTSSAVSHQLKVLKNGRLVKSRREGKSIFYALADDHVRTIISQGMDHIGE